MNFIYNFFKFVNFLGHHSTYNFAGKNNKIYVNGVEYFKRIPGLDIEITGDDNIIYIADKDIFIDSNIYLTCNKSEIRFGNALPGMKINKLSVAANDGGNNQRLTIGDNVIIWGLYIILSEENSSVIIGKHCVFSDGICIHATDSHALVDHDTGECINRVSGPILIGDHCWLGHGVSVLKNAQIPQNTVCGLGSVITKKFTQEHTVLGGNPARVIRKNVDWHYISPGKYEELIQKHDKTISKKD